VIERILQLIRPNPEHAEQCRFEVAVTIQMIADLPPYTPPNVVRRQLQDISAKLRVAQSAIDELAPGGWRMLLHAGSLVDELERVGARAADLAKSITSAGHSGGGRDARTDAMRKHIAADRGFDLLTRYGHCTPTSTRGGDFCQLAALLVEAATGQEMDVERACAHVIKNT
jgi:hypothetical protein